MVSLFLNTVCFIRCSPPLFPAHPGFKGLTKGYASRELSLSRRWGNNPASVPVTLKVGHLARGDTSTSTSNSHIAPLTSSQNGKNAHRDEKTCRPMRLASTSGLSNYTSCSSSSSNSTATFTSSARLTFSSICQVAEGQSSRPGVSGTAERSAPGHHDAVDRDCSKGEGVFSGGLVKSMINRFQTG
ncbi:unnamed protein product [Protopolystoma xenopodis]|uniref:Uncharacterized protein n=1 Tax=Protopolystoma xenopodis TaxID=117903 RepID=A0A448XER4_9PLAT|nr:unnamed protein product [Protopolystoma xenopodis]